MDYQSFQPNPPGSQMSEQIPSVHKNFTPKFAGIVVGLLVLGGVAYGIWWWGNKSSQFATDETSNWKTYTNILYGYSISYPPNYLITTTDYCGNDGCELRQPTSSSYEVTIERPTEASVSNEAKRDVLMISLNKKGQEYFSVAPGERSLDFGGYQAKIVEGIAGELQTKSLVIDRKDYIFHISADYNQNNGGVSFDILSTFRFIDSADTSTWQTYHNEEYGFEFKYPKDWRVDTFSSLNFNEGIAIRSPKSNTEVYPYEATILVKYGSFETSKSAFEENILPNLRKDIDHQIRYAQFNDKDTVAYSDLGVIETENMVIILGDRLVMISYLPGFDQILSTFKFIESEPTTCIQVITPARNLQTGEIRDFPTPCDVPPGWVKI
ncbi:MAG: hypothetical protein UT29_C0001G0045 [Candidatus Yanofskybacteria bacterium GW2011_GWA1_39_13]|uniref:Uncharacterized protein n=1 Tax=Yanofskybacteria sp. (strain GW2011_GWA1_39_13) TaxID=1619019 RepID=A0A0G0PWM4_YANXG|nr:MAG: hypothetical protein UT29_C0001G0045 [Candidatus Yanofskybacteria bacterium GW2011_GWA1_39_13]